MERLADRFTLDHRRFEHRIKKAPDNTVMEYAQRARIEAGVFDFYCLRYCGAYLDGSGTNSSTMEFMQYRLPVGGGPSSNRCPKWLPQRPHCTSTRSMP